MDLFHQDDDDQLSIEEEPLTPSSVGVNPTMTYDQVVRDLIQEERQYLRDLHLIMKVFREQLATLVPPPTEAELRQMFEQSRNQSRYLGSLNSSNPNGNFEE